MAGLHHMLHLNDIGIPTRGARNSATYNTPFTESRVSIMVIEKIRSSVNTYQGA